MRYQRQIVLLEISKAGQKKIQQASVLCVGAGGLGSPVLWYLAAAGIGRLGVVDSDQVVLHNLQRQILFTEGDIGQNKSTAAISHLQAFNHTIRYEDFPVFVSVDNALALVKSYDYIIDCTDNIQAKLLLNDACHQLQKPLISASVEAFRGQLMTFWVPHSGCLRCLYPTLTSVVSLPNCETLGVLGVIPGTLGILQALEVLRWVLNIGETMLGKLYCFDALDPLPTIYQLKPNPECLLCTKKVDFATLWQNKESEKPMQSHQITVQELAQMFDNPESFFLLDVRHPDEHESFNIGGHLIPLTLLPESLAQIPQDKLIVIYCRSGHRSQLALEFLHQQGFQNVKNLIGGVLAWQQIASELI